MKPRAVAGGALFALLLPLLGWLPYRVGVPAGTASASAIAGYHNGRAFLILFGACIAGLIALALFALREPKREIAPAPPLSRGSIQKKELLLIAVGIAIAYCPFAFVRYAPYVEDDYWLSLLHRMEGGLRPYVDFESLYGPLMIMLPRWWMQLFGYSAFSYAVFIMIAEASLFVVLAAIFQRLVPEHRPRRILLLLLAVLLANTLIGLSWNGWRRFAPALILLLFALRPLTLRTTFSCAIATALLLAYSHDFGALTAVSILGLHVYLFGWERRREAFVHAVVFGVVALASWLAFAFIAVGGDIGDYVEHAIYGASRFADEASFPFYWTLNSLSAFALLVLGLYLVAPGLVRRDPPATTADLLLLGGVAYALLAMKSGLNRADMWHVAAPLLPMLVAILAPWPRARFPISVRELRLLHALIAIFGVTYFLALLPTGSFYARGLVRGAIDAIAGKTVPPQQRVALRGPSIEYERSEPREDILATGAFLAAPERKDRPVFLYGNAWDMDKRLGVFRIGYPTDDFLLSDDFGLQIRSLLEARRDTLVVMRARPYRRLLEQGEIETLLPNTTMSRILGVLSTIHYPAAQIEYEQKERRWARTVGEWLVKSSTKTFERGDLVVLELQ